MATYPTTPRHDFLQWCQTHAPVFAAHAAALGLTPAQLQAFQAAVAEADDRLLDHARAVQAARLARQQALAAFATLRGAAGGVVRTIRARAETSADPLALYALAQIPPPGRPTPLPPPAQPQRLTTVLEAATGALTLRWKAAQPSGAAGTTYLIRRRLPGETGFSFVGASGKKRFVDRTVPAGAARVQYTVQGQRADLAGPVSPIFTVHFGRTPDGGRTASVRAARAEPLDATLNVTL